MDVGSIPTRRHSGSSVIRTRVLCLSPQHGGQLNGKQLQFEVSTVRIRFVRAKEAHDQSRSKGSNSSDVQVQGMEHCPQVACSKEVSAMILCIIVVLIVAGLAFIWVKNAGKA